MRFNQLGRRDFISLLGGAAVTWPLTARAQQSDRMRRIGMLMGGTKNPETCLWISAFQAAIRSAGWVEGRNVEIEIRWASGDVALIRAQASELVAQKCDVIVTHASPATLALRAVTNTVPNVFVVVGDPVGSGFVNSFARPGTNATGFTNFEITVGEKWLELLREIASDIQHVSLLLNPKTYVGGLGSGHVPYIQTAASSFGMTVTEAPFNVASDIKTIFAKAGTDRANGVIVMPDTSTNMHTKLITELAANHRVPTMYPFRFFLINGGLISYGTDIPDLYRRSASYVDRILKGEKPSDLPVQNPTRYEMAINLKTARALGLTVPGMLLARADEVIE